MAVSNLCFHSTALATLYASERGDVVTRGGLQALRKGGGAGLGPAGLPRGWPRVLTYVVVAFA